MKVYKPKFTLRPYQQEASDAAVNFFRDEEEYNALIIAPTGCHAKGSKILMYDGSLKAVENIIVGDVVMGDDGTPRNVLALHRGHDEMYRITPIKGEPFIVNGGHMLHLYRTCCGFKYESEKPGYDEISVEDYIKQTNTYKHIHKLHRSFGVEFKQREQKPIEPYFVGLYLGDGCSYSGIDITTMRDEVASYLYEMADRWGLRIRRALKRNGSNKASSYYFVKKKRNNKPNPLMQFVKAFGLCKKSAGDKFIPNEYKFASRRDRLELLAGLLDTDSYYDSAGNTYDYCSKSLRLAKDIEFLCRSLGLYAKIGQTKFVNGTPYYRISITGDTNLVPTKVGIRKGHERKQKKSQYVTGFSVEAVGKGEYYGFTLDGNHLYCDEQFFVHHNCGKSLIIADIAYRLGGNILILQPSAEILQQNYEKMQSYGVEDIAIYSASCGSKDIARITFATIGSIIRHKEDFVKFGAIIIDEADVCNAKEGMYVDFITHVNRKVLGLTATPYRLSSQQGKLVNGVFKPCAFDKKHPYDPSRVNRSIEKMLTGTRPRIFHKIIYQVPIQTLLEQGFLARLHYYSLKTINMANVRRNSTGLDYDDRSLFTEMQRSCFTEQLAGIVRRVMHPKKAEDKRTGVLVFVRYIEQAVELCRLIPGCAMVSGETPKKEREEILTDFKNGRIKVLANVGILVCGFDFPALDTVVFARPTMSLRVWYQSVGRIIRPYKGKKGWVIDLGGNLERFGRVEDLQLVNDDKGRSAYVGYVQGQWRPLTGVYY